MVARITSICVVISLILLTVGTTVSVASVLRARPRLSTRQGAGPWTRHALRRAGDGRTKAYARNGKLPSALPSAANVPSTMSATFVRSASMPAANVRAEGVL